MISDLELNILNALTSCIGYQDRLQNLTMEICTEKYNQLFGERIQELQYIQRLSKDIADKNTEIGKH